MLIEMHLKEDAQRRKEGKPEVFGYASVMGGDINTIPAFCCLVEYGRLECFEHVLNKWPEVMKEQLLFESAAGRTTQQEQAKHSKPLTHLPPSLSHCTRQELQSSIGSTWWQDTYRRSAR